MKKPIEERQKVIQSFIKKEITKQKAAMWLSVSIRSVERYRNLFLKNGPEGLKDGRHSNYFKLSPIDRKRIVQTKEKDRWRSARNIKDELKLPAGEHQVQRIIVKAGLGKENLKRIKPIQRFEAPAPNDLWQTDIMGKIFFPNLGALYLIATIDDYSRFVPEGRWYKTQGKINVFQVWYVSLSKCGLPKKMLQDEGSQYKAKVRFGEADYQSYAKSLGIELIWAKSAECKGKIERFWKFVQSDFVPSVLNAQTPEEVNGKFKVWLAKYNYVFKSRYFGGITRISRYRPSDRKLPQTELQTLLTIEERRKVTRESTISLYGKHYYVPPGYISCRIWVKIKGNKLYFEANGKIFWKTRLKDQ